jgi:tetratricopeptide (TPR) repeat protein
LLANALYADGAAEPAERIAAEAIAAAEQARAYEELGMALNCRACALIELARPVEAVELFEAALEIRERYSPSAVPSSLGNIAITLAALGRFEEAVTAGQKAMAAAERLATRVNRNLAALHLARALFSLGQWDEALALVDEVAPETDMAYRGMIIGPPVLVALHRGELERAQAVIEEFDREQSGQEGAFESDYRRLREVALAHLCGAHQEAGKVIERAQSGDYAEWPTWLPLAVDLVVQLQDHQALREAATALRRDGVPRTSPMVVAQSARLDALLAFGAGNRRDAASSWSAAIEVAGQAGMIFDAAALKLELFEHLRDHAGAVEGLQSATATFTRLGAAPWLTRALDAKRTAGNRQNRAPLEPAAG